jgi:hypothetical protein
MAVKISDGNHELRYEYRMTFFQAECNPIDVLVGRILALFVLVSLAYLMWKSIELRSGFSCIVIAFVALCVCRALFGWGRWTRSVIYISFQEDGLATNHGNLSYEETRGIPYRFLKVEPGLAKASVIRSITGHFIVVPKRILESGNWRG